MKKKKNDVTTFIHWNNYNITDWASIVTETASSRNTDTVFTINIVKVIKWTMRWAGN
jgi:hypothetical protein